jgi:hypothetical protein
LDHQGTGPNGDPTGQVHNPTDCGNDLPIKEFCAWNDQDARMRLSTGYVEGAWTDETCLFADVYSPVSAMPKSVYVSVSAPTDTLAVEVTNDSGDRIVAPPSAPSGNGREWLFCFQDPVAVRANVPPQADLSLFWPEVPFSNGGYAQKVRYFLTLTSLRRTRNVSARFEIAGTGPIATAPRSIKTCSTR